MRGIPYITRTSLNNGLDEIVKEEDYFGINKGNAITLGAENADFFYQEKDYITGNKMYRISNKYMNKQIGLFLVQVFRESIKNSGFGYGKGLTGTRFKERIIMLPVDNNGYPHWQFMENYIKQEQKDIAHKIISYYEQKMIKTGFDLMGLDDVEWKDFKISDLFETFKGTNGVQTPTGSYISRDELIDSNIPRITARETNNGIDGYYHSTNKNFRVFKNFISVSFMGSAFYHSYEASLDMKVHALIPKNFDLTENIALFIIQSLKNNTKLFSYGNQLSSTDLPHQKILLPIDSNGNLHLEYIDTFIRKIKLENIEKALQYIYIYKLAIKVEQEISSLTEKQWKDFKIEDLFEIRDGYYNKKPPLFETDGKIPFLGATAFNNGLTEFYSKETIETWDKVGDKTNKGIEKRLFEGNCLTIVNNGSVGHVYYQESKFTCSHDMTPVYLKNNTLNRHTGLFLVRCLMRSGETYSYARKWRPKRIRKSKIYLPIDNNGNPDYLYMQKYMQIQEIKNLYKVLNYYYSLIE